MELIYFLDKGERIKSKNSKFRGLKKWLSESGNPFSYFATHAFRAFFFDRAHRSPEVHATSKLSSNILLMRKPKASNEGNEYLELHNIMQNIWKPLIEILNGNKCKSTYFKKDDFDWLQTYLNGDDNEKIHLLKIIFDEMK